MLSLKQRLHAAPNHILLIFTFNETYPFIQCASSEKLNNCWSFGVSFSGISNVLENCSLREVEVKGFCKRKCRHICVLISILQQDINLVNRVCCWCWCCCCCILHYSLVNSDVFGTSLLFSDLSEYHLCPDLQKLADLSMAINVCNVPRYVLLCGLEYAWRGLGRWGKLETYD